MTHGLGKVDRLAISVGCVCGLLFALDVGSNLLLTGLPLPLIVTEHLNDPVPVDNWDAEGLLLANGKKVMPLGMLRLPEKSLALETAVRRSVELAPDGRVFCQIRIWHTCGTGPVLIDYQRVDLGQILTFLSEGQSERPFTEAYDRPFKEGGAFGRRGWADMEYSRMKLAFKRRAAEDARLAGLKPASL